MIKDPKLQPRHLRFALGIHKSEMLFLVAYDIPDDGTRTLVANELENWGARVQYSVFECDLDPARRLLLAQRLAKLICAKDSIRIYRICRACAGEVVLLGRGRPVMRDPDFYEV